MSSTTTLCHQSLAQGHRTAPLSRPLRYVFGEKSDVYPIGRGWEWYSGVGSGVVSWVVWTGMLWYCGLQSFSSGGWGGGPRGLGCINGRGVIKEGWTGLLFFWLFVVKRIGEKHIILHCILLMCELVLFIKNLGIGTLHLHSNGLKIRGTLYSRSRYKRRDRFAYLS